MRHRLLTITVTALTGIAALIALALLVEVIVLTPNRVACARIDRAFDVRLHACVDAVPVPTPIGGR